MNLLEQATAPIRRVLSSKAVMSQLSKPGFTVWSIAGFILLNMVTSPIITMFDKKTPKKERTYSAERQFFQELLVLGSHLTIATQFEKWGAKLGALIEPTAFKAVSKAMPEQVFTLSNFSAKAPSGWDAAQAINRGVGAELRQATNLAWAQLIKQREIVIDPYVMGTRKAGAIVGSILATAVVGPKLNNLLLTPFLKAVNRGVSAISGGRLSLPTGEETADPKPASTPSAEPGQHLKDLSHKPLLMAATTTAHALVRPAAAVVPVVPSGFRMATVPGAYLGTVSL